MLPIRKLKLWQLLQDNLQCSILQVLPASTNYTWPLSLVTIAQMINSVCTFYSNCFTSLCPFHTYIIIEILNPVCGSSNKTTIINTLDTQTVVSQTRKCYFISLVVCFQLSLQVCFSQYTY